MPGMRTMSPSCRSRSSHSTGRPSRRDDDSPRSGGGVSLISDAAAAADRASATEADATVPLVAWFMVQPAGRRHRVPSAFSRPHCRGWFPTLGENAVPAESQEIRDLIRMIASVNLCPQPSSQCRDGSSRSGDQPVSGLTATISRLWCANCRVAAHHPLRRHGVRHASRLSGALSGVFSFANRSARGRGTLRM